MRYGRCAEGAGGSAAPSPEQQIPPTRGKMLSKEMRSSVSSPKFVDQVKPLLPAVSAGGLASPRPTYTPHQKRNVVVKSNF